eukprot:5378188-Prorocentrum_lima.AAC.1
MTSSLVGSEMCIRDRETAQERLQALEQELATRTPAAPPAPASAGMAAPVSYTHLTLPTICSV